MKEKEIMFLHALLHDLTLEINNWCEKSSSWGSKSQVVSCETDSFYDRFYTSMTQHKPVFQKKKLNMNSIL